MMQSLQQYFPKPKQPYTNTSWTQSWVVDFKIKFQNYRRIKIVGKNNFMPLKWTCYLFSKIIIPRGKKFQKYRQCPVINHNLWVLRGSKKTQIGSTLLQEEGPAVRTYHFARTEGEFFSARAEGECWGRMLRANVVLQELRANARAEGECARDIRH